ncbi:hypothetical protein [Neobacillus vireti]|uniref:hypothetical protein n=1 Tax=Neobacillus vireti TaxID=220686 RepID=UPI002FFE637E
MKLFKDNLEQELFKVLQMSEENIIIISPFMSLNIAEKLVPIVKTYQIDCKVITRFERSPLLKMLIV